MNECSLIIIFKVHALVNINIGYFYETSSKSDGRIDHPAPWSSWSASLAQIVKTPVTSVCGGGVQVALLFSSSSSESSTSSRRAGISTRQFLIGKANRFEDKVVAVVP